MNDREIKDMNKKQPEKSPINPKSSFINFASKNKTPILFGIGAVCLVGGTAYLHQQGFFKGNKVTVDTKGFSYEPEHTVKVETNNNESKIGAIDNFSIGTNPSLKTGDNTAKQNINNIAIDKDTPQNVTDFLSSRRNT